MTSFSPYEIRVNVLFLRDAEKLYGSDGFRPSTPHSAGVDLRACPPEGGSVDIAPGERLAVPTGVAIEPDAPGVAAFIYSRSGLGAVKGLTVAQGVGLVDPDYRGEITVFLLNTGRETYTVQYGERIAQLVFQPFVRALPRPVDTLGTTERGAGGFGHTGNI